MQSCALSVALPQFVARIKNQFIHFIQKTGMEDCLKNPAVHRKTLLKSGLPGIQGISGIIAVRDVRRCSLLVSTEDSGRTNLY